MLAIVYCFWTLGFLKDFLADANRFLGRLLLVGSFFSVTAFGGFGKIVRASSGKHWYGNRADAGIKC